MYENYFKQSAGINFSKIIISHPAYQGVNLRSTAVVSPSLVLVMDGVKKVETAVNFIPALFEIIFNSSNI